MAIPIENDKRQHYQRVGAAASATLSLSGTGSAGDHLSMLIITPLTVTAGQVAVQDGTLSTMVVFPGVGTLADTKPISLAFGANSVNGAWKIQTSANVVVTAFGKFS